MRLNPALAGVLAAFFFAGRSDGGLWIAALVTVVAFVLDGLIGSLVSLGRRGPSGSVRPAAGAR
jgi:hypothetical protein